MHNSLEKLKAPLLLLLFARGLSHEAFSQRSYSDATYRDARFRRAVARRADSSTPRMKRSRWEKSRAVAPVTMDTVPGQWTLIGPQPLMGPDGKSNVITPGNMIPHSGWVSAVAVDPQNSSVVYLGTNGGGVWKTTDGGQTWTPLTDNQLCPSVWTLVLDPTNPDIIYVGTIGTSFGKGGEGILKSINAGATWSLLPGPLPVGPGLETAILSLAVSPTDGNIVLAIASSTSGAAVYRSADGGNTWAQVIAPASNAWEGQIVFDATNANNAYATFGGVYKSTDGGMTWATANGTGSNALPAGNYYALEIAPSSPNTLFVGALNSAGTQMFKTTDGGQNWTPLPGSPPNEGIQVDPVNSEIVFTGAGSYRSMDGGLTWSYVYDPAGTHSGLAFSADGSILYVGGEWGAWAATNLTDSNVTLTNLNGTLALTNFSGITIHPTDPTIAFGGTQSNGVDMYSGTSTWQWAACDDGGADGAFDFMDPSTIYTTCFSPQSLLKSTDGGATFTQIYNGIVPSEFTGDNLPALAMDPSDSQRLYFAAAHVWETNDGAKTWTAISPPLGNSGGYQTLSVSASDPNTVYLGNLNGVFVTSNALTGSGATWTNVSAGLPLNTTQCNTYGAACIYLSRITADPSSPGTAYAALGSYFSGHVYKTTNRGVSWTDVSGNLPNLRVADIAVDPDVPDTLYIGTEQGVWTTSDEGNTWSPLGAGLPSTLVSALKLHRPTRILRAATFGRSVWDLQLAMVPSPVVLSASSLAFGTQPGSQTVTLTNTGAAPLTLYRLTVPSGFTESNTCGIQLQSGGNCNLTVTFAPPANGPYSDNVTLTDDAPGSPQLIAVSGTGSGVQNFSLSAAPSSTTVRPGQDVSYTLSVLPYGGFNHAISFTCTGVPSEATCSAAPNPVTPDGTNPASATVTITTTAPRQVSGNVFNWPSFRDDFRLLPLSWVWMVALIAILLASRKIAPPRLPALRKVAFGLILLLAMAWPACGGGASGTWDPGTPVGTYTLTVSGTYAAGSTTLAHEVTLTLTVN